VVKLNLKLYSNKYLGTYVDVPCARRIRFKVDALIIIICSMRDYADVVLKGNNSKIHCREYKSCKMTYIIMYFSIMTEKLIIIEFKCFSRIFLQNPNPL